MKTFFSAVIFLGLTTSALASWHYNEDAGFGIYQPEGWSVVHEGRSSRLTGPEKEPAKSDIFLGSDWQSKVKTVADLKSFVQEESGSKNVAPVTISDLPGFRSGSAEHGSIFVLRIPENVVVVQYDLKGSPEQREEGKTMLGSIEIRTHGNENLVR